jgi:hypothetical protein
MGHLLIAKSGAKDNTSQFLRPPTWRETVLVTLWSELRAQRQFCFFVPVTLLGILLMVAGQTRFYIDQQPTGQSPSYTAESMAQVVVATSATLLSLVALLAPVSGLVRDRQRRTSALIWSRPISTSAYLFGRFLGALTPCLTGAIVMLLYGMFAVLSVVSPTSNKLAVLIGYLALYSVLVPTAMLVAATFTGSLAALSGSEEVSYLVGIVYWLAARGLFGNAWMVNFVTVTLLGITPSELSFQHLGIAVLLNRLFYAVLSGACIFATCLLYTSSDHQNRLSLGRISGRTAFVVLALCALVLVCLVLFTMCLKIDALSPFWPFPSLY